MLVQTYYKDNNINNNINIPENKIIEKTVWQCGEDDSVCDLTPNVLQRDGDTCRHLPRGAKRPVSKLLICTYA